MARPSAGNGIGGGVILSLYAAVTVVCSDVAVPRVEIDTFSNTGTNLDLSLSLYMSCTSLKPQLVQGELSFIEHQ